MATSKVLEICREFDGIDLTECNRRLGAHEEFDDACHEAMSRRISLGEQIKEALGDGWNEFEERFTNLHMLAESVAMQMIIDSARDIVERFDDLDARGVKLPPNKTTTAIARLRVLLR